MHNFPRSGSDEKDGNNSPDKHGNANTELIEDKCRAMPHPAKLKVPVEPRGENKQLFHPTITTGIAPMAVLIYMNAAIFAGESKGLHVGRRFNRHNKNSTPTLAQPRPSITCVFRDSIHTNKYLPSSLVPHTFSPRAFYCKLIKRALEQQLRLMPRDERYSHTTFYPSRDFVNLTGFPG